MGILKRLKRFIKENRFYRGIYFFYINYCKFDYNKLARCGSNVGISLPNTIVNPRNLYIGDNVGIAANAHL